MKNRDWLLKTAAVDVLCEMNDQMRKNDCDAPHGFHACIMDCFMTSDAANKRCKNFGIGVGCSHCIEAWLNEERRTL